MSIKEELNDLLAIHAEYIQAKKTMERCEKELAEQAHQTMKLLPKRTYKYIHEGQLVIVNTKDYGCPQIVLPEVVNTDFGKAHPPGSILEGLDDAMSVPR